MADTDQVVQGEFAGDEIDADFREAETHEIEIDSEDDLPPSDDDEDGMDEEGEPTEDVGIVPESEIYGPPDEFAGVDHSLAQASHADAVLTVAVNVANPQIIASGGQDDVAVIWGLEEQADGLKCVQKCRLEGHTDTVVQVSFSHDGQYIATGAYDSTVRIWTAATGALLHALEGPAKEVEWLIWHPKGHALLAGSSDTMAWMWWAPSGKLMQIFAGHAQGVTCGCWLQEGKLICTGSDDKSIIIWNPRAGTPQQHARNLHEGGITCICAHPDPSVPIVVTGAEDGLAKVVHIENGNVLAVLSGHTDSVETVAFNTPVDGGLLLLATCSMDGRVHVWDGKSFTMRHVMNEHFEKGGVIKFKWLPPASKSPWLCTCSADGTLRLFDALSGKHVRVFRGHKDTVFDVDLSIIGDPGNQKLCVVSCSDDKTLRVFVSPLGAEAWQTETAPAAAASSAAASSSAAPA